MKRGLIFLWATAALSVCSPVVAQTNSDNTVVTQQQLSVTGYLRDLTCVLMNPAAGEAKDQHSTGCMKKCVEGGAPLGILTKDNQVYTLLPPEAEIMSPKQRQRFLPYVGKWVQVTGTVVHRGGSQAFVVNKINVLL